VTSIKVIHASEFIHAAPDGRADLERAKKLLAAIATAGEGIEGFQVLMDMRRLTRGTKLTPVELWLLAEELVRYRKSFAHKTAILCPRERFARSAFFALVAQNKGFHVQAFTDYEDAMAWLQDPLRLDLVVVAAIGAGLGGQL
jgi:hypothetical protein